MLGGGETDGFSKAVAKYGCAIVGLKIVAIIFVAKTNAGGVVASTVAAKLNDSSAVVFLGSEKAVVFGNDEPGFLQLVDSVLNFHVVC
jgi:hypothetical protein